MRFISLLLALGVAIGLYFWIFQRDQNVVAEDLPGTAEQVDQNGASEPQDATASSAIEDDLIRVIVRRSTAREIDSAVVLRGETEALRQVEVRAETSSTVISDPLRKGSFVEEGQLLCALDSGTRQATLAEMRARVAEATSRKTEAEARLPEARARVIEAQARIDEAMVNQNAAQRLSEGGFAAETRVKNAEAAVAAAEATLEGARAGVTAAQTGIQAADAAIESAIAAVASAEKELERIEIRAPFEGLLESDTAELGTLLQPGSLCATVIQLDPIKLVGFVPETDVDRIVVGASAGARLAAGNRELTGTVTFLSRSADETTRTFRVEIEVPNPDLSVRDGQTANIAISAEGARAHLLPASALTLDADGDIGLRVTDEAGLVSFNPVTILRDTPQGVWLSGLPEQANVIVVGQEFVTAGVTVAPTFEEQTQ